MGIWGEFGWLFLRYAAYIVVFAAALLALRATLKVPDYIFRKLLHTLAYTTVLPLLFGTEHWYLAVLVKVSLLLPVFVVLRYCERFALYPKLFVEKEKHEVVGSFLLLFTMLAALMALFWGGFGPEYKYMVLAAILAWGPGDAAAAIVGRNWGRHKLSGPHIEGTKSVEGCVAMGLCSFVFSLAVLLWMGKIPFWPAAGISLLTAAVSALTELYTKRGLDTVTVPLAASLCLSFSMLL